MFSTASPLPGVSWIFRSPLRLGGRRARADRSIPHSSQYKLLAVRYPANICSRKRGSCLPGVSHKKRKYSFILKKYFSNVNQYSQPPQLNSVIESFYTAGALCFFNRI